MAPILSCSLYLIPHKNAVCHTFTEWNAFRDDTSNVDIFNKIFAADF